MIKIIFKLHNIYVNDNEKVLCSEDKSYEKMEDEMVVSFISQIGSTIWKLHKVFKLKTIPRKPILKCDLEER